MRKNMNLECIQENLYIINETCFFYFMIFSQGHDTTAQALIYTLMLIANETEAQVSLLLI